MSFELRISLPKGPNKKSRNDNVSHPTTPMSLSYAAEIVGNDDDLLNKILLRLPIKSLLKFKSISKHWLSLISNPNFCRRRSPFPIAASGIFLRTTKLWTDNPESHFVDFDHPCPDPHSSSSFAAPLKSLTFANDPFGITIIQSCNGLLLCSPRKFYYVYNPTTKKHTTLPSLSFRRGTFSLSVQDIVLAFDPSKSPHYKVVCVMEYENNNVGGQYHRIQIYSPETGRWRPSGVRPSFSDLNLGSIRGVFCNGAVHWLNPWGTSLYFKVDEEQQYHMPFPIHDYFGAINEDFRYVGESRDYLHAVVYVIEDAHYLNVYELERNYARWVLKLKVDVAEIARLFKEIVPVIHYTEVEYNSISVKCFVRGEVLEEDSFLVLRISGMVLRYDFKTNTIFKLCDNGGPDSFLEWCEDYQYIQSLACVW